MAGGSVLPVELGEIIIALRRTSRDGAGVAGVEVTDIRASDIRASDGDHHLSSYEVTRLMLGRGQPGFDREPIEEATREDLRADLVADFLRDLRGSRPALARLDDNDLLRRCGVMVRAVDGERVVPSLGGLVALGDDPQSFPALAGCAITVTAYPTARKGEPGPNGERFLDDRVVEGPVPDLLDETLAVLLCRMSLPSQQNVVIGAGRTDRWEYPLEVPREILANAVAHRDYGPSSRGIRIQVELYPDRLEVTSPGGLFGSVGADRLGTDGDIASPRNRTLVDILENVRLGRDLRGVCAGRATGIPTVRSALRRAGLAPARFEDRIRDFRVTVSNRTPLDEAARIWLVRLDRPGLSTTQQTALAILRSGRALTFDEYRAELDLDRESAREELDDLARRGLVRTTNHRGWARYVLADVVEAPALPSDGIRQSTPKPDHREASRRADATEVLRRKQQILVLLAQSGPLSRTEIATRLGLGDRQVLYALSRLSLEGLVVKTTPTQSSPYTTWTIRAG
jgi:ATP-dependent DNA helicase RecG